MSDTTDIKSTLMYGTNNKIRPYFYAYQRSEEERKSSHNESDLGGETVGTEVTGKVISLLEACFDLILSASPSMKIQIMGGKITGNLGFKSPLRKVTFFLFFFLLIFKFFTQKWISFILSNF